MEFGYNLAFECTSRRESCVVGAAAEEPFFYSTTEPWTPAPWTATKIPLSQTAVGVFTDRPYKDPTASDDHSPYWPLRSISATNFIGSRPRFESLMTGEASFTPYPGNCELRPHQAAALCSDRRSEEKRLPVAGDSGSRRFRDPGVGKLTG